VWSRCLDQQAQVQDKEASCREEHLYNWWFSAVSHKMLSLESYRACCKIIWEAIFLSAYFGLGSTEWDNVSLNNVSLNVPSGFFFI
jgi:hypothetical protein